MFEQLVEVPEHLVRGETEDALDQLFVQFVHGFGGDEEDAVAFVEVDLGELSIDWAGADRDGVWALREVASNLTFVQMESS